MRTSTPNILILTGGAITIAPLVFLYLFYRLSSYTILEAIAAGRDWDKVNFRPLPPEYYVPVALVTGVLCIAAGVALAVRDGSTRRSDDNDSFPRISPD